MKWKDWPKVLSRHTMIQRREKRHWPRPHQGIASFWSLRPLQETHGDSKQLSAASRSILVGRKEKRRSAAERGVEDNSCWGQPGPRGPRDRAPHLSQPLGPCCGPECGALWRLKLAAPTSALGVRRGARRQPGDRKGADAVGLCFGWQG